MDGVSWSTTRAPESFSSSGGAADTLTRLASFISRAETKQQMRSQRQRPPLLYVCPECGKSFSYATDLLHHQELKHTLPKPHRCSSCGQTFSLRSTLQLHKCDGVSTACERCSGDSRLGSLCAPCTSHSSDPSRPQDKKDKPLQCQPQLLDRSPYACAPCGRGFSQKQALLQHQQAGCSEPPTTLHPTDANSLADDSPPVSEGDLARSDSPDTPGPSSRAVGVCKLCSRSFRTEAGLQRHKQTIHAKERLVAPQRLRSKGECASKDTRRGGDGSGNGEPNTRSKSSKKRWTCRSCDMVFSSTSKLYVHRTEKHSREKNIRREQRPVISRRWRGDAYPCQVCGRVFHHHLSLRAHYRRHSATSFTAVANKSQPVECTSKDNTLSEKRPNKANNKTARSDPERPRRARLDTKLIGTRKRKEVPDVEEEEKEEEEEEEREFPCPSCAEVFPLQSQLREHVELHQSSVKRRHCSVCTKEMDTCKWPGSRRHRLYHCVPCQQGFSAMDSFLEHCQEHLRVRVEEDSVSECCPLQAHKA